MNVAMFLIVLGAAAWGMHLVVLLRFRREVAVLEALQAPAPPSWPKISLIVPARDEARHLEAALRSKLAQDYPALEVMAIDDRSTDGTGELLDRIAQEDARVRALHVRELPEGWLGKVHAMHLGIGQSSGEWLLLSDADVHLAPDVLRKTVAWAEAQRFDHLAVLPTITSTGLLLDAVMSTFLRSLLLVARPWAVGDPRSTAVMGVGAFNLVRRSAYERTAGLEDLRLEVGDDVALGQMLKHSGARSVAVNGRRAVSLQFYESVPHMARHVEKAAGLAAVGPLMLFASSITLWVLEVSSFLALAVALAYSAWAVAATAAGLSLAAMGISALAAHTMAQPLLPALLIPLGATVSTALTARAAVLAQLRGGIYWRGTFHSLEQLRGGARFKLGAVGGAPPR
jgi:hypothetical protein